MNGKISKRHPRRDQEGGFALLLVFLFAAAVAFAIYQELPRAAFESARDKEQLLIDRGKQYERAIEVYYAVNKRFPAELKDLEDSNQKRFLRRRYKDPMTGEDEWRLIHTNGSYLTDSLVKKPPEQSAANGSGPKVGGGPLGSNSMNTATAPAAAAVDPNPGPAVNAAVLRRPSDRGFSGNSSGANPSQANSPGGNPSGGNPAADDDPSDPSNFPPISLVTPNAQPGPPNPLQPGQQPNGQIGLGQLAPGQNGLGQNNAGQGFNAFGQAPSTLNPGNGIPPNQNPNQFNQGFNPNQQNQGFNPNQQNQFNNPFNNGAQNQSNPNQQNQFNQAGQVAPQVNPLAGGAFSPPGQNPAQQPPVGGLSTAAGGNAALQAINNQLFRPNQGAVAPSGDTGSPGIAGVASKRKGASIKSYHDRLKYQEWEFVFDPSAKLAPTQNQNPNGQNPNGQNPNGQVQNGLSQNGQTPNGQNQNNLNQPGLNQPGFNQPGLNQGQPGTSNPFSQPNPFSPQTNPGKNPAQ